MNTKFVGVDVQHDPNARLQAYREAFIAIKVLVGKDTDDDEYTKSVTRFSNKQNAIRGKDFLALFDEVVKDLTADDLFVPWMIALQAKELLGYTALAQRNPQEGTEHRAQTRYLFLYLFFRLAQDLLMKVTKKSEVTKDQMYNMLKDMKADYDRSKDDYNESPGPQHPFIQLLFLTDEAIATYMALAEDGRWYTDRNSFLKREELIKEERIIQATAATKLKIPALAARIQQIMSKAKS